MGNFKTSWILMPNGKRGNNFCFSAMANFIYTGNGVNDIEQFLSMYQTFLQNVGDDNISFKLLKGGVTTDATIVTGENSKFNDSLGKINLSVEKGTYASIFDATRLSSLESAFQFSAQKNIAREFEDFHADFFGNEEFSTLTLNEVFTEDIKGTPLAQAQSYFSQAQTIVNQADRRRATFSRINNTLEAPKEMFQDLMFKANEQEKKYDIRAIIAELIQEPEIMRMLGLMIDFDVKLPDDFNFENGDYTIALDWPIAEADFFKKQDANFNPYPKTHIRKKGDNIWVIPKKADKYFDNLLKVDANYEIRLHDPDQETFSKEMQASTFIEFLERTRDKSSSALSFTDDEALATLQTKTQEPLPSLPTEGFMLFKKERKDDEDYANLETGNLNEYKLDNMMLGFAVGVVKSDQQLGDSNQSITSFKSLMKRDVKYSLKRDGRLEEQKKPMTNLAGWITIDSAMLLESAEGVQKFALSNKLFRWDGFSLVCEHPLRDVVEEDQNHSEGLINPADIWIQESVQKTKETPTEKSLEKLRFSKFYSFVMWPITLNGHSPSNEQILATIKSDTTNAAFARSLSKKFTRSEPIASPSFAFHHNIKSNNKTKPRREGESMYNIAIRNFNAFGTPNTIQDIERYIFPPPISYRLAEWHGGFDGYYGLIRKFQEASSVEGISSLEVEDALVKSRAQIATVRKIYEMSKKELPESVLDLDKQYEYKVDRESWKMYRVPYLSDPMAVGFKLRCVGVEGPATKPLADQFINDLNEKMDRETRDNDGIFYFFKPTVDVSDKKNEWPNKNVFSWRMVVKRNKRDGDYVTVIDKPRGNEGLPKYSIEFKIPKGYVLEFEMHSVCRNEYNSHFSENPGTFRQPKDKFPIQKFAVTHAVQRPLEEPNLTEYKLSRILTGNEDEDDKTNVIISDIEADFDAATTEQLELHARWNEFEDRTDVELPILGEEATGMELNEMLESHGKIKDEIEFDQKDTKYRVKHFQLNAISKFQEYFINPDIPATKDLNFARSGNELTVDGENYPKNNDTVVLNNKPPTPPVLEYLIPTISKTENTSSNGKTTTTQQVGNEIVAYIKRPHFTTGAEEKYCIVLKDAQTSNLYSTVGEDIAAKRSAKSISNKLIVQQAIQVEGKEILVLEERFDQEKGLWKVRIPIESEDLKDLYLPFYQFAFARYQKWSTPGNALSAIVFSDFVQTVPNRSTKLIRNTSTRIDIHFEKANRIFRKGNKLKVTIESLNKRNDQDILWRPFELKQGDNVVIQQKEIDLATAGPTVVVPFQIKGLSANNFRAVIEEYETYPSSSFDPAVNLPSERLVYSEIIKI